MLFAIVSYTDVQLSNILLRRSHSAIEASSSIHCSVNLTNIRLRTGFYAVVVTRAGPTIKAFIKKCNQCIKMRAEVIPYRMGNKAWLGDTKFGMGCFTHINCDIIGYFLYYPQGRVTKNSLADKVYALIICCLYSKAMNVALMKDYSSDTFKMAMCSHFCRYGIPLVVTADNGS